MFNYHYRNTDNRLCPVHTEAWPLRCGDTVTDSFHTVAAVRQRLAYMLNAFPCTLWRDSGHEGRMESVCFLSDFDMRYGENRYYAAVYLLTSGIDLYRRTVGCYTPTGIRFDRARRRGISIRDYDLLGAAKTIYYGTPDLTLDDLVSYEIIDAETFRLIVNAMLIVRYGPCILTWGAR